MLGKYSTKENLSLKRKRIHGKQIEDTKKVVIKLKALYILLEKIINQEGGFHRLVQICQIIGENMPSVMNEDWPKTEDKSQ